jgi:hypothetical protein
MRAASPTPPSCAASTSSTPFLGAAGHRACPARWGGIFNALTSLTIVFVPQIARIAESVTTQVRRSDYVDAARASGAGAFTIVRAHVLGNVLGPIFVYSTSLISVSMILASGLSFLGLGVKPPEPEWGLMLNHPAHGHLHPALGGGLAGRLHLRDLDFLQPVVRWPAFGHGGQTMSLTAHLREDPQDVGGPRQPLLGVRRCSSTSAQAAGPALPRGRPCGARRRWRELRHHEGRTLGVVGESGCGKSTTARVLMQLIEQDSGELVFDGQTVGSRAMPCASSGARRRWCSRTVIPRSTRA